MSEAFGQDRSGRCGEPEGALEEALRRTVGRPAEPRAGLDPVNVTMIRQWCEAFDDGNPIYWDPEAAAHWGTCAPHQGIFHKSSSSDAETALEVSLPMPFGPLVTAVVTPL